MWKSLKYHRRNPAAIWVLIYIVARGIRQIQICLWKWTSQHIDYYHMASLMMSQHRFRQWFVADRQHFITSAIGNLGIFTQMSSPGHNDLNNEIGS